MDHAKWLYHVCEQLFETALIQDFSDVDDKDSTLYNWFLIEREKVLDEREAFKARTLAKLTKEEREVLGYHD